ncbi:hypothetical protein RHGRI_010156 [Rhododendron griersonianum]|uniref:Uncharacterized protein n=1 Tax=Rhododendron griersonianum TaxID=479676 RepID=A0AAV6KI69_9ERIC|nr:hypothetical protein RHGRI_010156 [Rhododendron griersonianum]
MASIFHVLNVWVAHHVPCWSCTESIAFLGTHSTMDRLYSWGLGVDRRCILCHIDRPGFGLARELEWVCAHGHGHSCSNRVCKIQLQGLCILDPALGSLIVDEVRDCLCSWRNLKPLDVERILARN